MAKSGVISKHLNISHLVILHYKFTDREADFFNDYKSKFWKQSVWIGSYEGWNFNSGNYLFTTDTK